MEVFPWEHKDRKYSAKLLGTLVRPVTTGANTAPFWLRTCTGSTSCSTASKMPAHVHVKWASN